MRRTDVVTHHMKRGDGRSHLSVQLFQKGDACLLPFACSAVPLDLASARLTRGTKLEGPGARVLVLAAVGPVGGLGWPGGLPPGTRWQGGLLIDGEDHLVLMERTGRESDQRGGFCRNVHLRPIEV
jgi:hypothetical protein